MLLKADEQDCMQCRIVGSMGAFTIGLYLYYHTWWNCKKTIPHKLTLGLLGTGFFYQHNLK